MSNCFNCCRPLGGLEILLSSVEVLSEIVQMMTYLYIDADFDGYRGIIAVTLLVIGFFISFYSWTKKDNIRLT